MANVLAFLFVVLCVGLALWGVLRGNTLSCSDCSGDCSGCGGRCKTGAKLRLTKKQIRQIEDAKTTFEAKGGAL